jgi:hypothetical protein
MLKRLPVLIAAASMAATPSLAAGLEASELGARNSGAAVGAYLTLPFSGERSGKPQAGLRLQMVHDYRASTAQSAPVVRADAVDLRLVGDRKPTLYVASVPVTGEEARKHKLAGVGTLVTLAIVAAAVVGGIVILDAISDDDDENCLDPNLCD